MADMSVHKDILHSREGHPQSYVNLIFWFTFLLSHKSQGGPWLFSHKTLRKLDPSNLGLEQRTNPHTPPAPPKGSSFCTSNRVANSPEETLRLREALQGCFPSAFLKKFPGWHQTWSPMPAQGPATGDGTAGEKAFWLLAPLFYSCWGGPVGGRSLWFPFCSRQETEGR